jgi:hypothetical protein
MDLKKFAGDPCSERWNPRPLVRTGRDHDVACFNVALIGNKYVAARLGSSSKRADCHRGPEWNSHQHTIFLNQFDNIVLVREGVRSVAGITMAGELYAPVWELEHQRIPPLRAPAFADPTALEYDMLLTEASKVIAHGEASLTAANDDRFDAFLRHLASDFGDA